MIVWSARVSSFVPFQRLASEFVDQRWAIPNMSISLSCRHGAACVIGWLVVPFDSLRWCARFYPARRGPTNSWFQMVVSELPGQEHAADQRVHAVRCAADARSRWPDKGCRKVATLGRSVHWRPAWHPSSCEPQCWFELACLMRRRRSIG